MSFEQLKREVEEGIAGRNSGIPMGFNRLNHYIGIRKRILTHVFGATGCLSGSTQITYSRRKGGHGGRTISLEELYYKFNHIKVPGNAEYSSYNWDKSCATKLLSYKSDRKYVGQNEIVNVVESGIKETFILTTGDGNQIRATKDHRFMVNEKDKYKTLEDLYVGDFIYCRERKNGRIHEHVSHFGNRGIRKELIISIEQFGREMTYDVEMTFPYNNFLANDFVVHNSGKSAFIHSAYILNPFDWYMKNKDKCGIKLKVILFSMERSKIYLEAKWMSRKIFIDQGVLIPIPKLLGWWENNKLTKDEHDLFLMYEDYSNELLEVVDIIEGPQNPTGVYKYVRNYAKENGILDKPTEFTEIYEPTHPNEIVIVLEDHVGMTKLEKPFTSKKEAIDKLSEYNQSFRDILGYVPVTVGMLTRGLNNVAFTKMDSFEPTIDDSKESGRPGEDADVVISLFDPKRYRTTDEAYDVDKFIEPMKGGNYFRSAKILKNSYGEDTIRVGMGFMGSTGIFKELPKKNNMDGFDYTSLFTGEYFLTNKYDR